MYKLEVWQNRDTYTAKHQHNLSKMVADLQERQKRSGYKLVVRRDQAMGDNLPCPSALFEKGRKVCKTHEESHFT